MEKDHKLSAVELSRPPADTRATDKKKYSAPELAVLGDLLSLTYAQVSVIVE